MQNDTQLRELSKIFFVILDPLDLAKISFRDCGFTRFSQILLSDESIIKIIKILNDISIHPYLPNLTTGKP